MCGSKCIERGRGPRPGQYPVRIRSSSPLMITMGRGQGGRATRKGVKEVEQNLRRTGTTVRPVPIPAATDTAYKVLEGCLAHTFSKVRVREGPKAPLGPAQCFRFSDLFPGASPSTPPRAGTRNPTGPPPPTLKLTFEMAPSI